MIRLIILLLCKYGAGKEAVRWQLRIRSAVEIGNLDTVEVWVALKFNIGKSKYFLFFWKQVRLITTIICNKKQS